MPKASIYDDFDFEPTAWHHTLGDLEINEYLEDDKVEVTDAHGDTHVIAVSELREKKGGHKSQKSYPTSFDDEEF